MDAVARYREASERNDIEVLVETLAADAQLVSPLSGRMVFRGKEDLRVLLTAIYGTLKGLRWREEIGDHSMRAVVGDARVGPVTLGDVTVFELDESGRIQRIRPYLRPWLGLTLLALRLVPNIARNPGLVWRARRAAAKTRS